MYSADRLGESLQPKNDIVDELIGFGRWQLLSMFVLSTAMLMHMLNAGTEAVLRPDGWWCKKPNFLDNWTNVEWIMYSHSSDSCVGICNRKLWDQQLVADGYFQGCSVYNISYEELANIDYPNRPPIRTTDTIPCPYGIHYDEKQHQNLAGKFDMGCYGDHSPSVLWQSSKTFGKVLGYVTFGSLSDRIGRRIIFFISCGATPLWAIIVASTKSLKLFVISSLLYGFSDGGFCVCLVLMMEISTNRRRSQMLAFGCLIFALGFGLTASINHLFVSYDVMLICSNSIFPLMFIFIRFIPESPPWLFCCHKAKRLEQCVRDGARINKTSLPDNFTLIYIDHSGDDRYKLPEQSPDSWSIISEPEVVYEVIGITYLMMLYGTIFGSSTYEILATGTESYLANSLLAMSIVIGALCGQICLLLMGHRKILQISIGLVLISSIMLTIDLHDLKPTSTGPTITLLLINVTTVSLSYSVLLNYNARTLPTLLRGRFFGIWKAIWAFFVWVGNHDYVKFPTTAFAVIMTCILATLFSFNLKDIYNRELPDTVFDSFCFEWKTKPKRWAVEELHGSSSVKKSTSINWNLMEKMSKKNSITPVVLNKNENK